jgi:hypothetical protein
MKAVTQKTLKRLSASSILYIIFALVGAGVAIRENRPSDPGGWSTGLPALQDFLYGNGTAMSPPLYMIIAVAVLTLLAFRRDRWGKVGVGGLTICGLLFSIGALVEPILFEIFKPEQFDFFKTVIEIGMIIIPLVMMVLGVREWKSRHSTP